MDAKRPVDLRILQANERTLLAWIRTGIALMAFGFVIARISPFLSESQMQRGGKLLVYTGAGFLSLGTLANAVAAVRFIRIRAAILAHRHVVPSAGAIVWLAVGVALLGALLAVNLLLH